MTNLNNHSTSNTSEEPELSMEIESLLSDIHEVHRINLTTLGQEFQTLNIDMSLGNYFIWKSLQDQTYHVQYTNVQDTAPIQRFNTQVAVVSESDNEDQNMQQDSFSHPSRKCKQHLIKGRKNTSSPCHI